MESITSFVEVYIYKYSFIYPVTDAILKRIIVIKDFTFNYQKRINFFYILNSDIDTVGVSLINFDQLWKLLISKSVSIGDNDKKAIIKLVNNHLNPFENPLIKIEDNKDIQYYLKTIDIPFKIKSLIEFEDKIIESKFNNEVFFYPDLNYLIIIYKNYIHIRISQQYNEKKLNDIIYPYKISELQYFDLPFMLYGGENITKYTKIFDEIIFYLFQFKYFNEETKQKFEKLFNDGGYDLLFMHLNLLYLSFL